MVRAVVSESENGVPFPAWLLTPFMHWGESLPSIGLCFFHLLSQKTEKTRRKRNVPRAPNLGRGKAWALAKLGTYGHMGARFDVLCS